MLEPSTMYSGLLGITASEKIFYDTNVTHLNCITVAIESELFNILKGRVGRLAITNLRTDKVVMAVDYVSFDYFKGAKFKPENGKIYLTKQFSEQFGFQKDDPIRVTKYLTPAALLLWELGKDTTNCFGTSLKIHRYVAQAACSGFEDDIVKGRPGIFLNGEQLSSLSLFQSLRPLCGYKKFIDLIAQSPKAIGLVKIYFEGKEYEVDVYQYEEKPYPPFALAVTKSLFVNSTLLIGCSFNICSRFDVPSYEEAENLLEPPVLEKRKLSDGTYLTMLRNQSLEELKEGLFQGKKWRKFDVNLKEVLADFLDDLTFHASELANDPQLLLKAINYMDDLYGPIENMQEYTQFLAAIGKHEDILKQRQEDLMDLLQEVLIRQKPKCINPPLLDAFFKMGINLKNAAGENCLHLMFRLKRGNILGDIWDKGFKSCPHFISWLKERNREGSTPLHYICQNRDTITIMYLGKNILSRLNVEEFIDPNVGSPFHSLVEDLSKPSKKAFFLEELVKRIGVKCLDWLFSIDHLGETPWEKMESNKFFKLCIVKTILCLEDKLQDPKEKELIEQTLFRMDPYIRDLKEMSKEDFKALIAAHQSSKKRE